MSDLPYRLESEPGYFEFKVTSLLRDYLNLLMQDPSNKETIDQIISIINGYTVQLGNLRLQNRKGSTLEVYKAVDGFFSAAPDENKKEIKCKESCTACCFIEIDVSRDEAATILDFCREKGIHVDKEYLEKQASAGRKTYSAVSRCVFLKENLCSIYEVRPVACRKHWVMTDPALCDFSGNVANQVGNYFDINTEILASAMLQVAEAIPLEKALLDEMANSG